MMASYPDEGDELEDLRISVAEVMTTSVIGTGPSASVAEIAELMDKHNIGSVVIREGSDVLGIITERDIIKRCVAKRRDKLPSDVTAGEVMTVDPITTSRTTDIFEAAKKMCDKNIRRLIVLSPEGELSGIISMSDILKEAPHVWFILSERLRMATSLRSSLSLI